MPVVVDFAAAGVAVAVAVVAAETLQSKREYSKKETTEKAIRLLHWRWR